MPDQDASTTKQFEVRKNLNRLRMWLMDSFGSQQGLNEIEKNADEQIEQ